MRYRLFYSLASSQYLDVELHIPNLSGGKVELVLPHWRPGRYEAGNFAKNVKSFIVIDAQGGGVSYRKTSANRWEISIPDVVSELVVRYSYYAAELNAGSTWLDERQLYVNPVNCLMYCPDWMHHEHHLEVEVPENYQLRGGFGELQSTKAEGKGIHKLVFTDYDTLADTPFVATADLFERTFQLNGIDFHICLVGQCSPDWDKIIADFFIFSNEILTMMGHYPHPSYYFLVQVLPYAFYHGVEHKNSTVIAIGPGHSLMKPALYREFLGVSCHELFHVWNVKHIRPEEMLPYDFSSPNYSRLGYVYEGLTTYYGDLLLLRSGVYGWPEWVETFCTQLQKHFDNGGRANYSVADSSFDTWLDGYVPGSPDRKVSIYTEGCLLAFIADVLIRLHSGDHSSLDHVMRALWHDFGQQGKGYTEADYRSLVEYFAGQSLHALFVDLVHGTESYEPLLKFCLSQLGLEFSISPSNQVHEHEYGFKLAEGAEPAVGRIASGSPAENAGLMLRDRIIGVNDMEVRNNLSDLLREAQPGSVRLFISRSGRLKTLYLESGEQKYFRSIGVEKDRLAGIEERSRFQRWSGGKF